MEPIWYVMGLVTFAWVLIALAMDTEPDPHEEESLDEWWRDLGGEAGGA